MRELSTVEEVYAASGGDPFVRAEYDATGHQPAWVADGAVAFLRGLGGRSLAALGPPAAAATLAASVARRLQSAGRAPRAVTLPRGALRHLPPELRMGQPDDWDWFWTDAPPELPRTPWRPDWLDGTPHDELTAFLHRASGRHSAQPGSYWVRRWAGVRDASGELVATAAHCENVPGVPHLASIAAHPDLRGQGLGALVTAWITRELLAEARVVTLGMYADNDAARRLYLRLGYRREHELSSAPMLEGAQAPSGCCGVVDCPHG